MITAAGGGSNTRGGKGGRGGRGGRGSRGGRSGGDGGRQNGKSAPKVASTSTESKEEGTQTGEKRKRAVEPDGGHDVGVRGVNAPPALATEEGATKKIKTNDGAVAPAS